MLVPPPELVFGLKELWHHPGEISEHLTRAEFLQLYDARTTRLEPPTAQVKGQIQTCPLTLAFNGSPFLPFETFLVGFAIVLWEKYLN